MMFELGLLLICGLGRVLGFGVCGVGCAWALSMPKVVINAAMYFRGNENMVAFCLYCFSGSLKHGGCLKNH